MPSTDFMLLWFLKRKEVCKDKDAAQLLAYFSYFFFFYPTRNMLQNVKFYLTSLRRFQQSTDKKKKPTSCTCLPETEIKLHETKKNARVIRMKDFSTYVF